MHAAGKLAEAESAYRNVLRRRPGDLGVLLSLAQVLIDQSTPQKAAALLEDEVRLRPNSVELHLAYGKALALQRKIALAIQSFERAAVLAPSMPQAHFNLGRALHEDGQLARAVESYRRALTGASGSPDLHFLLANALAALTRWEEAERQYRAALKIVPTFPGALVNLGNVLKSQGRFGEARAAHEEAVRIQPQNADAHYNLGALRVAEGEFAGATTCFQRALALRPRWPEALNNLAIAVRVERGAAASLGWCEQALQLDPDFFDAHYNLGAALEDQRQYEGALDSYERALMLRPDSIEALEKVVAVKLSLCNWSGIEPQMERLRAGAGQGSDVRPFIFFALPNVTRSEQQAVAQQYASQHLHGLERRNVNGSTRISDDSRRLRIGYVSTDFHEHATSYLMVEAFECHDRRRFEVVAYSLGPDDRSAMRSRLVSSFDRFVDVRGSSVRDIAALIAKDGIDILIDLKGYTEQHRARLFAMRPSPLQVSYLGYPGTMGADFIDYLIADRVIIPQDHFRDYNEAIAWLPGCYQANDSKRPVESMPDRITCRLPESAFVFCCFNQSYKINPALFEIWCHLLLRVPSSILWLLSANPTAQANLRREAMQRGVQPDRLIFAERLPHLKHLARLQQADLFLDTTPCCAHTLASDALWAGVPVVTLLGETFASRVASSLLVNLGLDQLIANSAAHYEELAYGFASDHEKLRTLRQTLKAARSKATLFDGRRLAFDLERLYEEMWRRHVAGARPVHISL